jgi:hypothetical protein
VGKLLLVVGAGLGGLALCTKIQSVLSPTAVVASAPATAPVAGVASAYGTDNAPAVQALINAAAPTRTTLVFPANVGTGAFMFGTGLTLLSGTRLSGPGATLIAALGSNANNIGGCLFFVSQASDISPTLNADVQTGDAQVLLNTAAVKVGDTLLIAKQAGTLLSQLFTVQAIAGANPQTVTLDRAANAGIVAAGTRNVSYAAATAACSRITNPVTGVAIDGFTIKGRTHECFSFAGVTYSTVSNIVCDTSLGDADDHWFFTISGAYACRFTNLTVLKSDVVGFGVAGAELVNVDGFVFRGKTLGTSPAGINFNGAIACRVTNFSVTRCNVNILDINGIGCGFANGDVSDFTVFGTNHNGCTAPYLENLVYANTGQANFAAINIDSGTVGFSAKKVYIAGGGNGANLISDGSISAKWNQVTIVPNSDTATDQFVAAAFVGGGHTTIEGLSVVGGGTGRFTALQVKDLLNVANTVSVIGFDVAGNDTNAGGLPVVSIDETSNPTSKVFLRNGRISGQATTSCVQMGGGRIYADTVELLGPAINGLWVYQGTGGVVPTLRYRRVRWIGAFSGQTIRNDNSSFVNQGSLTLNGATPVAVSFTDMQPNESLRLTKCTNKNGSTAFDAPVVTDTPGTGSSVVSIANDTRIYSYEIA